MAFIDTTIERMWSTDKQVWATKYVEGWTIFHRTEGILFEEMSKAAAKKILEIW